MGSLIPIVPIDGGSFAERVSPVGPLAKKVAQAPDDAILHELVELASRVQGEDRKYANELISRRVALNKECARLRAKIRDSVEGDLAKRWETAKKNCRDAECEIENAKGRIAELTRDLNRAKGILAQAQANQADAERVTGSRFATAGTAKKRDAAILTANSEVEKAQSECARIQQEINQIVTVTLPALGRKFQKLSAEERRICAMVTGQVLLDEETGLPLISEL